MRVGLGMRNFNRCMQLQRLLVLQLQQQRKATHCFSTLISRPCHYNHQGGSPSPPSKNLQTHFLPSLSPNNCYLFLHQPAATESKEQPATESHKKSTHKEEEEEEEEEEDDDDDAPTADNCPDRLYSLATAADSIYNTKKNIDEGHQMLNIIKNHNRLHVDLANSRCVGSSRGWLLFINRTTLALHLLNPFHANPPIIPLPAIESLPFVLNSATYSESFLTPSYSVGSGAYTPHGCFNSTTEFVLSNDLNPISSKEMMILEDPKGLGVKKFAISSNPLGSGSNCYRECIIMILCANNQLAFWRLDGKCKAWTALSSNPKDRRRHELMYSSKEKLFYAIVRNLCGMSESGIEVWDLHTDPSSPKMHFFKEPEDDFSRPDGTIHEIITVDPSSDSHSSKLLMVRLYTSRGDDVGFQVFKVALDYERNEYTYLPMDHLGDRALLIDHNQATFVTASQFPNILKPNSIYFIHEGRDCQYDVKYDTTLVDAGLAFSLGDRNFAAPLFPSITNKIPENGASWIIPPDAVL